MNWVKSKVLGRGSYGTVSLAEPRFSNSDHHDHLLLLPSVLAVKSANIEHSSSLFKEGKILWELRNCPQIVACFGDDTSVEDGEKVYNLLLEYAPGGTFVRLINYRGGFLPESEVSMYAYMLLKGLHHIHTKGYVHCDLKPSNILVFPYSIQEQGRKITINRLKIADFGLAKKARFRAGVERCGPGGLYKVRGTALYSSPESVLDGQNEWPSDIWSLGCILIEIFTGKSAYLGHQDLDDLLKQIVTEKDLPEIPHFVSKKGRDFLKRCLMRDPRQRWTAARLLNHPFIVDNYTKLLSRHGDLLSSWEDEECLGCGSKWWSGESSFSTSALPAPIPLAPHQIFSKNHASPKKSSPKPARFLLPHQIFSKNNHAAVGLGPGCFLPHQILSNNLAAVGLGPGCLLPHQILSNNLAAREK